MLIIEFFKRKMREIKPRPFRKYDNSGLIFPTACKKLQNFFSLILIAKEYPLPSVNFSKLIARLGVGSIFLVYRNIQTICQRNLAHIRNIGNHNHIMQIYSLVIVINKLSLLCSMRMKVY